MAVDGGARIILLLGKRVFIISFFDELKIFRYTDCPRINESRLFRYEAKRTLLRGGGKWVSSAS